MILRVCQRDARREDLLVEMEAQGNIVLGVLRTALRQIRALKLQRLVVIDDPPQERPRIDPAFTKVDGTLCREVPLSKLVFVFGDWGIVVGGRGDRKTRPTERALMRRHLNVSDRDRRKGPEVDSRILVDFRHDEQQRKPARESGPTQTSMAVGRREDCRAESWSSRKTNSWRGRQLLPTTLRFACACHVIIIVHSVVHSFLPSMIIHSTVSVPQYFLDVSEGFV